MVSSGSVEAPPVTLTVGADINIAAAVPLALRRAIGAALTVENPAYRDAEERGRSTRDLDPWLFYYRQGRDGTLVVPRDAAPVTSYGRCARSTASATRWFTKPSSRSRSHSTSA